MINEFVVFEKTPKEKKLPEEVKNAGKGLFGILAGSYACYWMTTNKQKELGEKLAVKPEIVTYFSGLTGIIDSVIKIGGFFGLEKLSDIAQAHDHLTAANASNIGSLIILASGIWGLAESPYRMHLANKKKEGIPGLPIRIYEQINNSFKELYHEIISSSL